MNPSDQRTTGSWSVSVQHLDKAHPPCRTVETVEGMVNVGKENVAGSPFCGRRGPISIFGSQHLEKAQPLM